MFMVREMIETMRREKSKGYFTFLDIEKAYDKINIYKLFKMLMMVGMSEKILKITESMYEGTKAKCSIGNLETRWVRSGRGMRQGCVLSPLLFRIYTPRKWM